MKQSGNLINKKVINIGHSAWKIARFLLLFGLCFLIIKPFVLKITMAFFNPDDLLDASVNIVPRNLSLYYWRVAWDGLQISETLLNSVLLGVLVSLAQLLSSAFVGYGLARFRFKGHSLLFGSVIVIMLIPPQTYNLAQYLSFRYPFGQNFSLIDTLAPMFLMALFGMGFKQGLYIYLFNTFFKGLPSNLEDAALIDGAGSFRTFWSIILPNSRAVILTVLTFSFSWQWTDIIYTKQYFINMKVLPAMVSSIYVRVGLSADTIGSAIAQNAACILIILPLLFLFLFSQKYLTQSIAQTGMAN